MKKGKILLIDDDVEYAYNFGSFLRKRGYEIYTTGTGEDGIQIAKKEKPHIILCDLLMRDINGDEVLKKVKALCPDSIFIVVSGYIDERTKERLKGLGAHSFIEKIVKFKPTEEYIRKILEEKGITIER